MQVILLEKIGKLGSLGDLANVKSGYARNFLIPQGKAKPATKANMAEFETIKADLQAKEATAVKDAQTKAEAMSGVVCTIKANAGDEGKLFGSIGTADIVESLAASGHEIEKRDLNMPEAIRFVGEYEVSVTLYTDIIVTIKVIVEALEEERVNFQNGSPKIALKLKPSLRVFLISRSQQCQSKTPKFHPIHSNQSNRF